MWKASPGWRDTPHSRRVRAGALVAAALLMGAGSARAEGPPRVEAAAAAGPSASPSVPVQPLALPGAPAPLPGPAHPPQETVRPTAAWSRFCEQLPAECAVDPSEPAVIPLTVETWSALKAVNLRVNRQVKPLGDREHWGVEDRWDFPDDGYGDCEDYQILKRRILVGEAGLPRRALRMTVVIDHDGAGHAVLIARTSAGDLVLDNKTDHVLPRLETGYEFLKREGSDGLAWVSLREPAPPAAVHVADRAADQVQRSAN